MYDVDKIHDVVTNLKKIKASSFSRNDGPIDFQIVTETCRIIDALMLPLYYIWEHGCHQQLEDISFEDHLKKPYQRFIQNPITYTWELYIFVTLKEPIISQLTQENIYNDISFIYKELIEYYGKGEKAVIQ